MALSRGHSFFVSKRTHSNSLYLVLRTSRHYVMLFPDDWSHAHSEREWTISLRRVTEQVLYFDGGTIRARRDNTHRVGKKDIRSRLKRYTAQTSWWCNESIHRTCENSSFSWTPWDQTEKANWRKGSRYSALLSIGATYDQLIKKVMRPDRKDQLTWGIQILWPAIDRSTINWSRKWRYIFHL